MCCYIHDEILHLRGPLAPGHSYPFNSHLHLQGAPATARLACSGEVPYNCAVTQHMHGHLHESHAPALYSVTFEVRLHRRSTPAPFKVHLHLRGTPAPAGTRATAWYTRNYVVQPHLLGTCIREVHLHLRGTPGPAKYICAC
jgi:hypothetical protein